MVPAQAWLCLLHSKAILTCNKAGVAREEPGHEHSYACRGRLWREPQAGEVPQLGWDGQQQILPNCVPGIHQCTVGFTADDKQEVQAPCSIESSALLL